MLFSSYFSGRCFFTLSYVSSEFWQVFTPIEPEPAIFSETICLYLFVCLFKIVFC